VAANVTLRSNVHVGRLSDLGPNGRLLRHVRGHGALIKLLHRLEPGRSVRDSAALHLLPQQIAELYQTACTECGFLTVGAVRSTNGPVLQVRCPKGQCTSLVLPTKEILLDEQMLTALGSMFVKRPGVDLSEMLADALDGHPHHDERIQLSTVLHRRGVRLPPALHFQFYAWSERAFSEHVKACLLRRIPNA
jgi:hypothetical protein